MERLPAGSTKDSTSCIGIDVHRSVLISYLQISVVIVRFVSVGGGISFVSYVSVQSQQPAQTKK